jgi:poly-gamma-glutamate synthesis protein (capsule biosynthesis protein)
MIIGHHPHVVQDIQRYKNKPIIYSLGNFLFDQYFSAATEKGMYVLAHIPLSGNIEIRTWEVSSTP